MFLFEPKAKGKNREPGLQENSVRDFTERQVLVGADFLCAQAGKLLCPRPDLKGAAMFLFEPKAKGKNREPGLQENSVRDFTGRQVLLGADFLFISVCQRGGALHRAAANAKIYVLIRDGVMVTRMPLEH